MDILFPSMGGRFLGRWGGVFYYGYLSSFFFLININLSFQTPHHSDTKSGPEPQQEVRGEVPPSKKTFTCSVSHLAVSYASILFLNDLGLC